MRVRVLAILLLSAALMAQETAPATEKPAPSFNPRPAQLETLVIPAGTKVPLTLKQGLSSKNARIGDGVYAATSFPVAVDNHIVIPAGTFVQGVVSDVKPAGRMHRAELLVHFRTLIYPNGYTVALPGAVENAPGLDSMKVKDKEGGLQGEGKTGERVGTVASTAGTGALIGGLSRGGTGAAIGAGIGGAAGLAIAMLSKVNEVRLGPGDTLEMVFERSVSIDSKKADNPR